MPWLIFALISVVGTATANLLRRNLMKDSKNDPYSTAIVFQFLGAGIVFLISLYHGFTVPPITKYPLNFLFQAVTYGLGTVCLLKAYHYIEASEATIITTFQGVVTILSAVFLLHEVFTLQRVIGTILILVSVIAVAKKSGQKFKVNRGVLYALGMAVCFGLGATNDTYLIKGLDATSFLAFGFFTPGVFLLLINPRAVKHIQFYFHMLHIKKLFIFTLVYVIGGLGFYYALANGAQASQLMPINQSSLVLTVLLAAFFLHEKDNLAKKLFFSLIVICGVLLLT